MTKLKNKTLKDGGAVHTMPDGKKMKVLSTV
jgi:hypothetical protein